MVFKLFFGIGLTAIFIAVYLLLVFRNLSAVSIGSRIPEQEQIRPALMVMDIQEGITGKMSKNKRYQNQSDWLITGANKIIKEAKDANIPVIYIRFEMTNWIMNLLGGGILAQGSLGIEIDKRLEIVSDHVITRDQFDAFANAKLDARLGDLNVNCLDCIGVDAACCIDRTAKAAINRGFTARVIKDAVISSTPKQLSKALNAYSLVGIGLISESEWQGMITWQRNR